MYRATVPPQPYSGSPGCLPVTINSCAEACAEWVPLSFRRGRASHRPCLAQNRPTSNRLVKRSPFSVNHRELDFFSKAVVEATTNPEPGEPERARANASMTSTYPSRAR